MVFVSQNKFGIIMNGWYFSFGILASQYLNNICQQIIFLLLEARTDDRNRGILIRDHFWNYILNFDAVPALTLQQFYLEENYLWKGMWKQGIIQTFQPSSFHRNYCFYSLSDVDDVTCLIVVQGFWTKRKSN